jgi:hypothetical protein
MDRDLDGWKLATSMDDAQNLELFDSSRNEAVSDYPVLTRVTYSMYKP